MEMLPIRVQEAVDWLVKKVNQDHNLPPQVDLINEAEVVIQFIESIK